MIVAGCDVGSLTAEAVILKDSQVLTSKIMGVRATAEKSAMCVMDLALAQAGLKYEDIDACYSTGYGRQAIPFSQKNISEISCHGMGAYWADNSIRTIVDIGGQDCKVISIDENGLVQEFIMNDKCAAGTGRCLEVLAKALDVELHELGPLSQKARKPISLTNKCSIFMELEVMQHVYKKRKARDIAAGINNAVAKRVASLSRSVPLKPNFAITGGVSKNVGVVSRMEKLLGVNFTPLTVDPQIIGALGAAIFAQKENGNHD
ncbi:acyl-CoA dehydratase activase [Desulfatibacillum aliphaticivorans]|uniref:acyl-CoA dehydratase activase n=1 Tax=Desulfatibacillum aliphaticivorans TaxID=218208 RepID=UPI000427F167|nr:acyl-CoA dehydratase activase [Desulfatibacillum aliphaticivorans]